MRPQPIAFRWVEVALPDGAGELVMAMVPTDRYHNVAARQFGEPGSEHVLEPTSERSVASHNQYFAALHDAWANLPERLAARFPTAEHLRKRLLVEAGFCDQREVACSDGDRAKATALFMRELDSYAVISVVDNVVVVRRAKSQSVRGMGKLEFEASKKAVLDLAEEFTGVPRGQAMREAGRSA